MLEISRIDLPDLRVSAGCFAGWRRDSMGAGRRRNVWARAFCNHTLRRGGVAWLILAHGAAARAGACVAAPGSDASAGVAADAPSPEPPERQSSGYREALLQADERGQYAADALVDGLPVRMLVDTGASDVFVSASTAARLGLVPLAVAGARLRRPTACRQRRPSF